MWCRCVVWTGDGRVFFYNPSQRMSLWERPEELQGRADVDKMVQNPPETGELILLQTHNNSLPLIMVVTKLWLVCHICPVNDSQPLWEISYDTPGQPNPRWANWGNVNVPCQRTTSVDHISFTYSAPVHWRNFITLHLRPSLTFHQS